MRTLAVSIVVMVLWSGAPRTLQADLDLESVNEALALGRTGIAAQRARFHDAYRALISRAPIDYVDIVTPFRRIVLAVEGRAAAGDRGFGQRQALELLREAGGQLDVYVELTFHPLNTYIAVPAYDVALMPARGRLIAARSLDRIPRWTPRVGGLPPPVPTTGGLVVAPRSQALLGGSVVARFDLRTLDPGGRYEVVVGERNEEVGRVRVDLGRMR